MVTHGGRSSSYFPEVGPGGMGYQVVVLKLTVPGPGTPGLSIVATTFCHPQGCNLQRAGCLIGNLLLIVFSLRTQKVLRD